MDRLLREANPPTGQLASPKPQYKKPGEDAYEPVEGQYGAPFAILKNASGQVISPATDAKLEQVKSELELIKSELQTIKANQLSGDQKVQLSGTIVPIILNQSTPVITAGSTITEITDVDYSMYREIMVVMGSTAANGGSFEVRYNDIHARRFSERRLASILSEEVNSRRYFVDWHRPITPMFNLMVTNKLTHDERFEYGIMGRM